MGVIYLAYDRIGRREVALKSMSDAAPGQRALRLALFRREYDTLAKLPHPNIVEVYGYGEAGGQPYYVMELLGGSDLTTIAPLPYREACSILRDIASALSLVHTRRLVHRDVSPNNVRLTADGTAKLLDFGALAPFGRPEQLVGTAAFMAPECFVGAPLDQRADVYALGAVAYWTLTHSLPFPIRRIDDAHEHTFALPPAPPSTLAPDVPRELDALVLSMLARDPRARPANTAYIIERLTSIAELSPEAERRVAQSYLAHPPLCGRSTALASLHASIEAARAGRFEVALIESEAGVGRSSVLAATASHAELHGYFVLHAQSRDAAEPFEVVRQLVESARTIDPQLAREAETALVPQADLAQRSMIAEAERHASILRATTALVNALCMRAPLMLAIDDVERSDLHSLVILAALPNELRDKPVALVATCLARRSPTNLALLSRLIINAKLVRLEPLTQDDVGELVQTVFGPVPHSMRVAHWLYSQSAGNAAIALDYLRLLVQRKLVRYAFGTFLMPHDVELTLPADDPHEAARSRLVDLSAEATTLVQLLSLHTGALTFAELAGAANLTPRDALLAIEELTHRGIVAQGEHGSSIAGSSLRAAVESTLTAALRKTLHLQLADSILAARARLDHQFDASLHRMRGGDEDGALALLVGVAHRTVYSARAVRHVPLLVDAVTVAMRQKRAKEECLSLMLPLASCGFYGDFETQRRYADTAIAWMSDVCGLTLAKKLRPYLGGKLSLITGLTYAAVRSLRKERRRHLGPLKVMLNYFVALVCDSTALAAALGNSILAHRFVARLSPLSVLPQHSSGWLMREFCLATAEVAAGKLERAAARYTHLVAAFSKPVEGLENVQPELYLGSINGRGVCEAGIGNPIALTLADELGTDAFFAPHADVIRVSYHALRGDRETAEQHRTRAEELALRGGSAWSAAGTLISLSGFAACLSEDAVALVQVISDLEVFADASPALRAYQRVCAAWLEHVRGHSLRARELFEQALANEASQGVPTVLVNWGLYANVLSALGDHAQAYAVSRRVLTEHGSTLDHIAARNLFRELAVAQAGIGQHREARQLAASLLERAEAAQNPMELGLAHRDLARIALITGDPAAFDLHFAAMEAHFRATHNACLIGQCDSLLAKAEACGLRIVRQATITHAVEAELDGETELEPAAGVRR